MPISKNNLIQKMTNWEYWPSSMFYIPNLPYAFFLAFKAKKTNFFSSANPAIKSSGNGTESKFETIQLVPKQYRPKSILVHPNTNFNSVLDKLKKCNIEFPIIVKPDIGFRGLLVEKIHCKEQLNSYLNRYPIKTIIQEFLNYKQECGIFYYRYPNEKKGHISSFTLKKFITIKGDGISTLKELIISHNRAKLYIDIFEKLHKNKLDDIPNKNEIIKLTDIGNHSKGTKFINGNHFISHKLIQTFDEFSHNIKGLYYFRIDIKYNDFKELENGSNFKVIEINGIIAEPTHIYDVTNNTYLGALRTIRAHWKHLYRISIINHKEFGISFRKTNELIKDIVNLRQYVKEIIKLSKN